MFHFRIDFTITQCEDEFTASFKIKEFKFLKLYKTQYSDFFLLEKYSIHL
jgi:hypothetical protein